MTSNKPTLHFLCGKLASGKTTLARQIARDIPAVLIIEDEWLSKLSSEMISTFQDYLKYSARFREVLGPHIKNLLHYGVSVVFDFAGNTPRDRQWVRSLVESTGANHVLHYVVASDAVCLAQLKHRNETKPEGRYWATTTPTEFKEVTKYFVPPAEEEGFNVVRHEARKNSHGSK